LHPWPPEPNWCKIKGPHTPFGRLSDPAFEKTMLGSEAATRLEEDIAPDRPLASSP
jgi:hypothetical protein